MIDNAGRRHRRCGNKTIDEVHGRTPPGQSPDPKAPTPKRSAPPPPDLHTRRQEANCEYVARSLSDLRTLMDSVGHAEE